MFAAPCLLFLEGASPNSRPFILLAIGALVPALLVAWQVGARATIAMQPDDLFAKWMRQGNAFLWTFFCVLYALSYFALSVQPNLLWRIGVNFIVLLIGFSGSMWLSKSILTLCEALQVSRRRTFYNSLMLLVCLASLFWFASWNKWERPFSFLPFIETAVFGFSLGSTTQIAAWIEAKKKVDSETKQ